MADRFQGNCSFSHTRRRRRRILVNYSNSPVKQNQQLITKEAHRAFPLLVLVRFLRWILHWLQSEGNDHPEGSGWGEAGDGEVVELWFRSIDFWTAPQCIRLVAIGGASACDRVTKRDRGDAGDPSDWWAHVVICADHTGRWIYRHRRANWLATPLMFPVKHSPRFLPITFSSFCRRISATECEIN